MSNLNVFCSHDSEEPVHKHHQISATTQPVNGSGLFLQVSLDVWQTMRGFLHFLKHLPICCECILGLLSYKTLYLSCAEVCFPPLWIVFSSVSTVGFRDWVKIYLFKGVKFKGNFTNIKVFSQV